MSNEKQQTAVDWFHQKTWGLKIQLELGEISIGEYANTYATLYNQAKEMEKEIIEKTYDDAIMKGRQEDGEQYYEQTYGGNK
jgi:hypothetical protein